MTEPSADDVSLNEVRIDRWLFAARIFKSRNLASRAVSSGKVKLNGEGVKPHRTVRRGDAITLKRDGRTLRFTLKGLVDKRVGAAPAQTLFELVEDPDLDPKTREMIKLYRELDRQQPKSKGRPTKRDRRLLERFQHPEE